MTLIRHRQPADRAAPELKMLSSGVVSVLHVVVASVTLPAVVGGAVVGMSLTVRPPARLFQSCSVNTMVMFSPGRGGGGRKMIKRLVVELTAKLSAIWVQWKRTAAEDGQAGEVGPAGAEQDGGVSTQSTDGVPTGVLQGGRDGHGCHSHRDAVTLRTTQQIFSLGQSNSFLQYLSLSSNMQVTTCIFIFMQTSSLSTCSQIFKYKVTSSSHK